MTSSSSLASATERPTSLLRGLGEDARDEDGETDPPEERSETREGAIDLESSCSCSLSEGMRGEGSTGKVSCSRGEDGNREQAGAVGEVSPEIGVEVERLTRAEKEKPPNEGREGVARSNWARVVVEREEEFEVRRCFGDSVEEAFDWADSLREPIESRGIDQRGSVDVDPELNREATWSGASIVGSEGMGGRETLSVEVESDFEMNSFSAWRQSSLARRPSSDSASWIRSPSS